MSVAPHQSLLCRPADKKIASTPNEGLGSVISEWTGTERRSQHPELTEGNSSRTFRWHTATEGSWSSAANKKCPGDTHGGSATHAWRSSFHRWGLGPRPLQVRHDGAFPPNPWDAGEAHSRACQCRDTARSFQRDRPGRRHDHHPQANLHELLHGEVCPLCDVTANGCVVLALGSWYSSTTLLYHLTRPRIFL
ncbi:unnamed protein product [Ectocarpus sp. 4 AP-2014]